MKVFLQTIKPSELLFCLCYSSLYLFFLPRLFILLFFQFLQHFIQLLYIVQIPLTIFEELSILFKQVSNLHLESFILLLSLCQH